MQLVSATSTARRDKVAGAMQQYRRCSTVRLRRARRDDFVGTVTPEHFLKAGGKQVKIVFHWGGGGEISPHWMIFSKIPR